jgi:anti-anti-sigma factor
VTALLHRGNRDNPPAEGDGLPKAAPTLQVELDVRGPTCRLTLRGELCGTSLAALEAQIDQLGCIPCEQVVVDVRHLTQLDEVGAKVILGLYYYVLGRGGELRVTAMAGAVEEILRAAGGELLLQTGGLAN